VNAQEYQVALGRKIAEQRHRRGLSQPELARMIDRSVAWVSQVERGVRKVDRMSVLEMLATALDMPLSELAAEAPVVAAVYEEPPGAGGLRLLLSGAYSLQAMLNGHHAPSLPGLRAKVERAQDLRHAGQYTDLTDLLRDLLPDLESAARAVPDSQRPEAFELLATTYQGCSAALAQMGETEAAWIAADRAMGAAERAGNPLLVAAGAFRLVFVFIGARYFGQAEATAGTAADALRHLADSGTPQAMSLWGAVTLQRAMTAAHAGDAGDADKAYAFLDRARAIADRVGPGRNDYSTEFSPANVALYEIAVAVELGDAGRALRAGSSVDASGLSNERRARMLIDIARAYAQLRHVDDAVATVRQAEDTAPQIVRGHPAVRQLVSDLHAMQNPPGTALAALAGRLTAP
jgi:transcriptional regulator with XRE-family HTH domain